MAYLLPCECGQNIPVEPRQAGQSVACACGRTQEAPTLLRLRQLPRDEASQAAKPATNWGPGQRVAFVGVLVSALALMLIVALLPFYPAPPQSVFSETADVRETIEYASPAEVHDAWSQFRRQGLQPVSSAEWRAYYQALRAFRLRIVLLSLLLAGGIALIVVGLTLGGRARPGAKRAGVIRPRIGG